MSRKPLYNSPTTGRITEAASTDILGPVANPSISTDVATKGYVDSAVAGVNPGVTVSTGATSIAANTIQNYSLTMAKSFGAWHITEASSKKFRLRLYSTSAARTADASRPFTTRLSPGTQHGCILDLYIDQVNALTPWTLSPAIFGSNDDGSQATTIYASVTNIDTSTQTINVTISYVVLEN